MLIDGWVVIDSLLLTVGVLSFNGLLVIDGTLFINGLLTIDCKLYSPLGLAARSCCHTPCLACSHRLLPCTGGSYVSGGKCATSIVMACSHAVLPHNVS